MMKSAALLIAFLGTTANAQCSEGDFGIEVSFVQISIHFL
jgi:hypothetical protein